MKGKDMELKRAVDGSIVVLAVCAVILTVDRVGSPSPASSEQSPGIRELPPEHWHLVIRDRPQESKTVRPLVVFADYQCPISSRLYDRLQEFDAVYPDKIEVHYRHFPLERTNPHAFEAAVAAECAREQDFFQAFQAELYTRQSDIGTLGWSQFARASGVIDIAAFERCSHEATVVHRVVDDQSVADLLDLQGTPVLLTEGYMLLGVPPIEVLAEVLNLN